MLAGSEAGNVVAAQVAQTRDSTGDTTNILRSMQSVDISDMTDVARHEKPWNDPWKDDQRSYECPAHACVYFVGGAIQDPSAAGRGATSVDRFDPETGAWKAVPSMRSQRTGAGVAELGGKLYVVGGHENGYGEDDDGKNVSSVERFDPKSGAWEAVPPITRAHRGAWAPGVAVLGGKLYVVAGGSPLSATSVDRFDPELGAWEALPSMLWPAFFTMSLEALDGKLYAIGGMDHVGVQRFDPVIGKWEVIAFMSTPRHNPGLAVLGGKLYALGGTRDSTYKDTEGDILDVSSVERFDPKSGAWEAVASMGTARMKPSVAVLDGKLYALGGGSGVQAEGHTSVERFDPESGVWEAVPSMELPRSDSWMAARVAVL